MRFLLSRKPGAVHFGACLMIEAGGPSRRFAPRAKPLVKEQGCLRSILEGEAKNRAWAHSDFVPRVTEAPGKSASSTSRRSASVSQLCQRRKPRRSADPSASDTISSRVSASFNGSVRHASNNRRAVKGLRRYQCRGDDGHVGGRPEHLLHRQRKAIYTGCRTVLIKQAASMQSR